MSRRFCETWGSGDDEVASAPLVLRREGIGLSHARKPPPQISSEGAAYVSPARKRRVHSTPRTRAQRARGPARGQPPKPALSLSKGLSSRAKLDKIFRSGGDRSFDFAQDRLRSCFAEGNWPQPRSKTAATAPKERHTLARRVSAGYKAHQEPAPEGRNRGPVSAETNTARPYVRLVSGHGFSYAARLRPCHPDRSRSAQRRRSGGTSFAGSRPQDCCRVPHVSPHLRDVGAATGRAWLQPCRGPAY